MPKTKAFPQTRASIREALAVGWRPVRQHVRVMDGRDRNKTGVMTEHNMSTGMARVKFAWYRRPTEMPAHQLQARSLWERFSGSDKRR